MTRRIPLFASKRKTIGKCVYIQEQTGRVHPSRDSTRRYNYRGKYLPTMHYTSSESRLYQGIKYIVIASVIHFYWGHIPAAGNCATLRVRKRLRRDYSFINVRR